MARSSGIACARGGFVIAELEFFTVISHGLHSIQVDYVDLGTDPDEKPVYAFVDFIPREPAGTVHWLKNLTIPRGIQLDTIRGRYSPEDGRLRTIIGNPTNEQQLVTAPGSGTFTLNYAGQPTTAIPFNADPGAVEAALEALPNLDPEDVYVYRVFRNEKQTVTITGGATGGVFTLSRTGGVTNTPVISRNANAAAVQQAIQTLPTVGAVGCSVVGPVGGPWVVEFTGPLAGQDIALMSGNSAGLTPSGTVVISETVPGSSSNPYRVNFLGKLQGTDVPQMTGTNCTIITGTQGDAAEGVKLVANTAVMEMPAPTELIYDVRFTVPDLDPTKVDRTVIPFGIAAPRVGGVSVDLADISYHLPPKAL